jgi:hypothetical protein
MRIRMRIALPLVQVAIAVPLTLSNYYFGSEPQGHEAHRKLDVQLGFALNAPAMVSRNFLEAIAVQFCPEKYRTSPSTGCYPLPFAVETVVYFGLVGLLWYAVMLEAAGNGQSVLTTKTGMRPAADALAILFGAAVGVFGALISQQIGPRVDSFLVGIIYIIWAIAIMVFYGRDLWLYLGIAREQHRPA